MFVDKDRSGHGLPEATHYAFGEVASEIGCSESALRRRMLHSVNATLPPGATDAFIAIHLDDYVRLVRERGLAGEVKAPEGFPAVVLYDAVCAESRVPGHLFEGFLAEAGVRQTRVQTVSASGRTWALENLGDLVIESIPPEITGTDVTEYRNLLRNELFAAGAEKGKPLTGREKSKIALRIRGVLISRRRAA